MKLFWPTTEAGIAGLQALCDDPQRALLAFDFDGVIAPITEDPAKTQPLAGMVPILSRLATLVRSITIITGRAVTDVIKREGIEELMRRTNCVLFGVYGIQRWDVASNRTVSRPTAPGIMEAAQELPGLLKNLGLQEEVRVKDKKDSVAIHARHGVAAASALNRLRDPLAGLSAQYGLTMEEGRSVIELHPSEVDKGVTLIDHVHACGGTVVLYIGDDATDVPAYRAVDKLATQGVLGLKILSRGPIDVPGLTKYVDLMLDGPSSVLEFIDSLADALRLYEDGSNASTIRPSDVNG